MLAQPYLALHPASERCPKQICQGCDGRGSEVAGYRLTVPDALMRSLYAIGPPGHFRYLISPHKHLITSSPTDCPNSTFS